MNYDFNFAVIWRNWDVLLKGLGLGLYLALAALCIGAVIGLIAAFWTLSPRAWLRIPARIYVSVIRNTPLLVLILIAYFGLPQWGLRLGRMEAMIFTLAIYSGAYLCEVFRGGLIAIPKGLREAGMAIGLTEMQIRFSITLPVMLRNVLPALSNNFIALFKDTALAAAIAVPELTFQARKINTETFRVMESWLVASALYIIACYLIAAILRVAEQRLAVPGARS